MKNFFSLISFETLEVMNLMSSIANVVKNFTTFPTSTPYACTFRSVHQVKEGSSSVRKEKKTLQTLGLLCKGMKKRN